MLVYKLPYYKCIIVQTMSNYNIIVTYYNLLICRVNMDFIEVKLWKSNYKIYQIKRIYTYIYTFT